MTKFIVVMVFLSSTMALSQGLVVKKSSQPFEKTVQNLERILKEKKLVLFAKIDHSTNAKKAKLKLNKNTVFIFGNPKIGTPIMKANPLAGIDLPVKIQVFEEKGFVKVAYNDPTYLATRHRINKSLPQLAKMAKVLPKIVDSMTKK